MINIKDKPLTTPEQAKQILDRHTERYGIPIDLDKCLDYISFQKELIRSKEYEWQKMADSVSLSYTKPKDVRSILINRFGVPKEVLTVKGKEGLNKETIAKALDSEYVNEDAKLFINRYKELDNAAYISSYLQQYLIGRLLDKESMDGTRIVMVKPTWNILATRRISAKEPSLQNLTKIIADILTAPKGTILVRADSGQIEPRITYSEYIPDPLLKKLIIIYNDAYFGMYRFVALTAEEELGLRFKYDLFYDGYSEIYKGIRITKECGCPISQERLNELTLNIPVTEEMEDGRAKIKLYLLAGNYGGNLLAKFPGDKLAESFMRKIPQHPLRLQLQAKIDKAVEMGQETFYTAFGNPIKPEDADGKKYDKKEDPKAWLGHMKRCGFNNPIQGTASDLMLESVYYADKIISRQAKYDSFISYYKHDEGCFIVDERDSHIIDELKGVTAYNVRDWIPITSKVEIGKVGGTPDWYNYSYTGHKIV